MCLDLNPEESPCGWTKLLATNSLKLLLKLVILGCHLLMVQLYLKIHQK